MVPFSLRRDRPEPRKMPTITSGRAEVWSSGAALPLQARGSRLRPVVCGCSVLFCSFPQVLFDDILKKKKKKKKEEHV